MCLCLCDLSLLYIIPSHLNLFLSIQSCYRTYSVFVLNVSLSLCFAQSCSYNDLNDIDFGFHNVLANKKRAAVAKSSGVYYSDSESEVSCQFMGETTSSAGLAGSSEKRGRGRSCSDSDIGSEVESSGLDVSISPLNRPRGSGSARASPSPFMLDTVGDGDSDEEDIEENESLELIGNPVNGNWKGEMKEGAWRDEIRNSKSARNGMLNAAKEREYALEELHSMMDNALKVEAEKGLSETTRKAEVGDEEIYVEKGDEEEEEEEEEEEKEEKEKEEEDLQKITETRLKARMLMLDSDMEVVKGRVAESSKMVRDQSLSSDFFANFLNSLTARDDGILVNIQNAKCKADDTIFGACARDIIDENYEEAGISTMNPSLYSEEGRRDLSGRMDNTVLLSPASIASEGDDFSFPVRPLPTDAEEVFAILQKVKHLSKNIYLFDHICISYYFTNISISLSSCLSVYVCAVW